MMRQVCQGARQSSWERVGTSKARIRQMNQMIRQEVGFNDIEQFLKQLEERTHCRRGQGKLDRKILSLAMRKKVIDEKRKLRYDKRDKERLRETVMEIHGRQSTRYRKQMKYLHKQTRQRVVEFNHKYTNKVQHLQTKHKTEERKVPHSKRVVEGQRNGEEGRGGEP